MTCSGLSAKPAGHVEGLGDRAPDLLRVLPFSQGLVDRAVAETGQHEVLGDALRVGVAELLAHPGPEFGQPHRPRLPGAGTRMPAQSKFSGLTRHNRDI